MTCLRRDGLVVYEYLLDPWEGLVWRIHRK
jgi:hypothetical protein